MFFWVIGAIASLSPSRKKECDLRETYASALLYVSRQPIENRSPKLSRSSFCTPLEFDERRANQAAWQTHRRAPQAVLKATTNLPPHRSLLSSSQVVRASRLSTTSHRRPTCAGLRIHIYLHSDAGALPTLPPRPPQPLFTFASAEMVEVAWLFPLLVSLREGEGC
jgi:hypothetical protein